ncbi:hypothetical protein H5410_000953 [Solanum commersonii]|uniref:GIR1-like zinc ribbon domain-containing protein n=1 Tax=Solanum commersonii TaxID=4109 RepID=A0A9J6AXQ5_SOLCO|nr:hypothetical protein H5410_000953 [Solanum commersonii]
MKHKEIKHPNLDLKLNISSSPRVTSQRAQPLMERISSPTSSCVSREPSPDDRQFSEKTMMLLGCPACLMYVIILEENPKCPKCKSTVLLDFFKEERMKNSKT